MRLILRRIVLYVVTAIVAMTINFFLPWLLPGNPALAVLGRAQSAESPQAVAALETQYGVQTRTGERGQYVQYWDHLLHGNLLPAVTFFQAAPYFFVAILAVALFATKLGWFPPSQGYDTATLNPGFSWAFRRAGRR